MKRPKRKPAKKRAIKSGLPGPLADFLPSGLMPDERFAGTPWPDMRPITRSFLIRLAAVHASIIVSDKQGLAEDTYLKRFTDLIEKTVRDA